MSGLRMAKASEKDIKTLRTWLQFNDELSKINPSNEYEWNSLKNDWEGEDDFMQIINSISDEDGFNMEYYFDYYNHKISYIHMRIILGYEILLDNCCNPELDYLDFNAEIKEALEKIEK